QQRRKCFCPDLTVLWKRKNDKPGSNGRHNDDHGRDNNPAKQPTKIPGKVDQASIFGDLPQQHCGKEETRDRQKDVYTTGDAAVSQEVNELDPRYGESAHDISLWSVFALRKVLSETRG